MARMVRKCVKSTYPILGLKKVVWTLSAKTKNIFVLSAIIIEF